MEASHAYRIPPRDLLGVLTDESFLNARSDKFGGAGDAAVQRTGAEVVVTTPRQLPVEYVPAPARAFVGSGRVVQVDRWRHLDDDPIRGVWDTDVFGAPISLRGQHEISATATGCVYIVTASVKVNVPLVGGRLENEVRRYLHQLLTREQEFVADWLASGGG